MLYKLKSKAAGDLILLEPQGKQLLTLIGKRPEAQGIIAPEEMLDAMEALRQAIAKQEADQAQALAAEIRDAESRSVAGIVGSAAGAA